MGYTGDQIPEILMRWPLVSYSEAERVSLCHADPENVSHWPDTLFSWGLLAVLYGFLAWVIL